METLLCEVIAIYKNPKYRIIKYNDEYLMVNIINNWLVLFIPLLNWLTPKRYIKISQEELENLNTFKPAKNNAFWPALGSSVLFSATFRKYMPLFNVRLEKTIVIAIFFVVFLGILFFYLNLNRRLALSVFTMNKEKSQKMILLPNLKHFFFIIFAYLYFGGFSFFTLYALITIDVQNIIIFICWGAVTMFFFFINIVPIGIKKAHVILLKKS